MTTGSVATITASTFTNFYAILYGGVAYVSASVLTMSGSNFNDFTNITSGGLTFLLNS